MTALSRSPRSRSIKSTPQSLLPKLPPRPAWPLWQLGINNLLQTGVHVHLIWTPRPRVSPEESAMAEVQDQEGGNADICCEEIANGPFRWEKDCESVDQSHQSRTGQAEVCAVRLQARAIWLLDTLCLNRFAESEEHDTAADPRNETRGVGEVDEPVEHNGARVTNGQICQG